MHAKVWNDTVANLTLMALGSSAPEILLSVIELLGNNFKSGELGPSTIVGSAAFNLFVIMAVCVAAIPSHESRAIADMEVFGITAFFSVFAYLWMFAVLTIFTPNIISVPEAILTFTFFPIFVALAYAADKNWLPHQRKRMLLGQMVEIEDTNGIKVSKEKLAHIQKDIEQRYGENLNEELRMKLVCYEILNAGKGPETRSRAHHRINATRAMTGGKKKKKGEGQFEKDLQAGLEDSGASLEVNVHLTQPTGMKVTCTGISPSMTAEVTTVLKPGAFNYKAHGAGVKTGDKLDFVNGVAVKKMTATTVERLLKKDRVFLTLSRPTDAADVAANATRIEFGSEFYAVMENAGDAIIKVRRHGCLNGAVSVHYYTDDGSAKAGVRYVSQSGVLPFISGQTEAEIKVRLIDDEIWQDVEEFRVVLHRAEHPQLFQVECHTDPTGLLPDDVSLVVSMFGLEIADPMTHIAVQIPLHSGKPLKCFWSWDQIGHVGAEERQQVDSLNEGISIVHITCEGAGTFDFRCADFTHASNIANSLYKSSRSQFGHDDDESAKINEHKLKRQGSGYGHGSSKTATVLKSKPLVRSRSVSDVSRQGTKPAELGSFAECCVQVINDDQPGIIAFDTEHVKIREDVGTARIGVRRMGTSCRVTCEYTTKDESAIASRDYKAAQGTLVFEKNEEHKFIDVDIIHSKHFEKREQFLLILSNPTDGASFDNGTDGGTERCLCKVEITDDTGKNMGNLLRTKEHLASMLLDRHKLAVAAATWADQFADALKCHAEEDDDGNVLPISKSTYLVHYLALPWKLLFCLIPPVDVNGGWACFYIALMMTGGVTIIIGDLAAAFGCVLGLENSITAITFVALGTSLPDTFASMSAATHDPTADAAIGNVTGSNSVNVFLGLGLPWVIGAFYWQEQGPTEEWVAAYPEISAQYPEGGFAVPAGDLAFSVIVFSCLAVTCLLTLYYRRLTYGAELGGPEGPKKVTAVFFICLWLIYVIMSICKTKGFV
jgi:Ca2+/Na+ antiporter